VPRQSLVTTLYGYRRLRAVYEAIKQGHNGATWQQMTALTTSTKTTIAQQVFAIYLPVILRRDDSSEATPSAVTSA